MTNKCNSKWSSAYHRVSDDSVSSFGGHDSEAAAIAEAKQNIQSPDIDMVWVRDASGVIYLEERGGSEIGG